MLSPQLRKKVHSLWSLFWTAGITNPLAAIEQITYLLFIRQLESLDRDKESGKNGQFRTPRHVIRFMVELLDPQPGSAVLDPACGSGGFLINTLLHWKAKHTDREVLRLEWDGAPRNTLPVWP